jgi:chromosomal replication initiation ATPase DnaA
MEINDQWLEAARAAIAQTVGLSVEDLLSSAREAGVYGKVVTQRMVAAWLLSKLELLHVDIAAVLGRSEPWVAYASRRIEQRATHFAFSSHVDKLRLEATRRFNML